MISYFPASHDLQSLIVSVLSKLVLTTDTRDVSFNGCPSFLHSISGLGLPDIEKFQITERSGKADHRLTYNIGGSRVLLQILTAVLLRNV